MGTRAVVSSSEYFEPRTNYVRRPILTDVNQWSRDAPPATRTIQTGGEQPRPWLRFTGDFGYTVASFPLVLDPTTRGADADPAGGPGTYYYGFTYRQDAPVDFAEHELVIYSSSGERLYSSALTNLPNTPGWHTVTGSTYFSDVPPGAKVGIEVGIFNFFPTDFTFDFLDPWISKHSSGFFSGDSADTSLVEYSWSGAVNLSPSLKASKSTNVRTYELEGFNVQEASSPIAAGDSSGQVSTFSFSIPIPDKNLTPDHPILTLGASYLIGQSVHLTNSRFGFTQGEIKSVSKNRANGTIQVSGQSRLGRLNVYNLQAQPFNGSLGDAIRYYVSLAETEIPIDIHEDLEHIPVVFPGWEGELWYRLKQLSSAMQFDIVLLNEAFVFRPLRSHVASQSRNIDRTPSSGGGSLAQSIEVYNYNNRRIVNELVYPIGGWSEEVPTFNVNSGETIEEILELSSSLTSVQQPVMQTFVSQHHESSSVFTVVGDDGLPISPTAFYDNGGHLSVTINPDTTSLTLRVTAPTNLPNRDGSEISVYGIALSAELSTGRYSTLRIVGSGVEFNKEIVSVRTGVDSRETATEVGVTIDNPFMSNFELAARAGKWAVSGYNGSAIQISGNVVSVIPSEESTPLLQAFGNVAGARVWDESSRRFYRVREGTTSAESIQFSADDDLMYQDHENYYGSMTYAQYEEKFAGYTYRQVEMAGLR